MLEKERQNIAGHCQQTLCIQMFVDNIQQCFAFSPCGSSGKELDRQQDEQEVVANVSLLVEFNEE